MRIIAGEHRGIRLLSPSGLATRPTSDRVKEALFSILSSRINLSDLVVLDIFAGTGSLGIEALSRGARLCYFIEYNRSAVTVLSRNLANIAGSDRSEIFTVDALKALQIISKRDKRFDLVFLDPPYSGNLYQPVLDFLCASGILSPEAIVVAECSARNPLNESYGNLRHVARRVYGDTALELFVPGE